MFARRHWIPPAGLLFAQACHGLSWILVLWVALRVGVDTLSPPALAWIHLAALGWFTVAALSILLHVIPAFTELRWRSEHIARASLAAFAVAVGAFVLSLLLNVRFAGIAAAALFFGLLCYAFVAWWTLSAAAGLERTQRAIARAIAITLLMLVVAASLGLLLSFFLSGTFSSDWIARLPAAHANLGLFGWLSLLVYGVSARTVGPICGAKSRFVWVHIVVGASTLAGAPVLAIGLGLGNALVAWIGAGLLGLGALAYIADMVDILLRATESHRAPQAFVAAAIAWLLVAIALGAATLAGRQLSFAYGFAALIGWTGQMVNAHTLHIGTRLIATVYRGDDDETRPAQLLDRRLTWASFGLFQAAVGSIVCGLAFDNAAIVSWGAAAGLAGWLAMIVNLSVARARARVAPA
jgi:hypothetical protein